MTTKNTRLFAILITIGVLLSIPLIAMQFTSEVNWTPIDFIVATVLLLSTGLSCELVLRKVKKFSYRAAICISILLVCFLVWAELAVGIFGTPFAGN